ncbi:hypothetical protein QQX10_01785 [Demequina sp. SYSU T00039]|uniref:Integral membrane protein n=1 Tax=Demequina lignilytica TaxID=3051663 RepID=A0AAW7M8C1_9MICO|nr:hypothetical protein [Demequina sp. SYSU T00039]MDN4486891.1 hypothetical protein [Demequina sp. SYSU T00039]
MNWARTVVSALIILVAASLFSAWAVSAVAVRAIEDGTAVHGIAEDALDDPEVVAALGDAVADSAVAGLQARGIDPARLGLEDALRTLITDAVDSDTFKESLLEQVDAAHEQLAAQLGSTLTTPAPLTLEIDVSGYVNAQIDTIPLVGVQIPDIQVDPIEVEALDAETFDDVRSAYQWLRIAQDWALWTGIGVVVVGMFVTLRLRWFLPKVGAATAAIAGALFVGTHFWGVEAVVALLPGGKDGSIGRLILEVVTEAAVPAVELRLLELAAWALIIGLVFFLIGVLTYPRPKPQYR